MSTVQTTNLKHESSGSNNIVLDSSGNFAVQAGTVSAPAIQATGDSNTGIYFPAADNIGFTTGGTIRGRWTTDGLCFNADTAAANALDDYEEGTWTPAITDGYTRTYGNRVGRYIKIGSYIYVFGQISLATRSGAAGSYAYITLPFPANGMGQIMQPVSVCSTHGFTHTSIITVAAQWDAPTELRIYETTANANANYLSPSGIPASGEIGFYYVYYTTS